MYKNWSSLQSDKVKKAYNHDVRDRRPFHLHQDLFDFCVFPEGYQPTCEYNVKFVYEST